MSHCTPGLFLCVVQLFQTGRVVEQGTHDELIAKNGAYANMVAIQMGKSPEEERKRALEAREYEKKVC